MSHVKIMATLLARSGKAGALEALLFGMAPHCRMEPGNLRWDVWRTKRRPTATWKINDLAEQKAFVLDPALVANKNG
jgi:quinol monooxygenase YgiN